jgi:hypothetical protein
MAIDQGNTTTTQNIVDRTWRIEFFVDEDDTVQIRCHRELRAKDTTSGKVVSRDRTAVPIVQRASPQIATKSYTAGGVTATGQQLLQLLNKMSDTERQVDIDAGVSP